MANHLHLRSSYGAVCGAFLRSNLLLLLLLRMTQQSSSSRPVIQRQTNSTVRAPAPSLSSLFQASLRVKLFRGCLQQGLLQAHCKSLQTKWKWSKQMQQQSSQFILLYFPRQLADFVQRNSSLFKTPEGGGRSGVFLLLSAISGNLL